MFIVLLSRLKRLKYPHSAHLYQRHQRRASCRQSRHEVNNSAAIRRLRPASAPDQKMHFKSEWLPEPRQPAAARGVLSSTISDNRWLVCRVRTSAGRSSYGGSRCYDDGRMMTSSSGGILGSLTLRQSTFAVCLLSTVCRRVCVYAGSIMSRPRGNIKLPRAGKIYSAVSPTAAVVICILLHG